MRRQVFEEAATNLLSLVFVLLICLLVLSTSMLSLSSCLFCVVMVWPMPCP